MIEAIMYFGLGFCAAGLTMVLLVPLVHGRAVRLTTRRLEAALPSSAAEIIAAKDLQRAEFALATRRLETKLDALRTKDAKQRAELGRKTDSVNRLRLEIEALHEELRRTEHNRLAQANEIRQLQRVVSENESTLVETRSALKATSEQLVEERTKFASFQDRIAAGVQQAAEKISRERAIGRQAQQDLQRRLTTQSQVLSRSENELSDLRNQLATTCQNEHALRTAMHELERQADAATATLRAENSHLQAALQRANGERVRLAYHLTTVKQRTADNRAA
jgi:chromosome segregation ATPase